jgi:hypothetical protein
MKGEVTGTFDESNMGGGTPETLLDDLQGICELMFIDECICLLLDFGEEGSCVRAPINGEV